MIWIILVVIAIAALYLSNYHTPSSAFPSLKELEEKIQYLQPSVTSYLKNCKDRLTKRLNEFSGNKARLRIVTKEDLIRTIDIYKNDLAMVEIYIQLSEKFKNDSNGRMSIAIDYYSFLSLIDNWRKDNANLGGQILDDKGLPGYSTILKIQEIRKKFNNLLKY